MVTLESGRISPADVIMIKLVLESANEITHYGIIFNKLGKDVLEIMKGSEKKKLLAQISTESSPEQPEPILLFLGVYEQLEDKEDATTTIPELEEFTKTLLPIKINSSKVKELAIEKYEKLKMQEQLTYLNDFQKEINRKISEFRKLYLKSINSIISMIIESSNASRELKELQERNMKNMREQLQQMDEFEKKHRESYAQRIELQKKNHEAVMERMGWVFRCTIL